MTYNPITYTASGGQTVFNIPFTRISDTYIKVATKLVGATNYITQSVSTNYTIVGNTVVFNIGLDSGVKVRIWRSTNRASLVDFNGVNNLTSSNLGLTTTQQSNIAEEVESDLDDLNAIVDGIVTSVVGFDPDNVSNTYLELQGDVAAYAADVAAAVADLEDAVADLEDATTSFAAQTTQVATNTTNITNLINQGTLPNGYVTTPVPTYTSARVVNFNGIAAARTTDNVSNIVLASSSRNLDLNTTGANGLNTGTVANNTWYYVYLYQNGYVASTTNNATTLTIASVSQKVVQLPLTLRTDGSANILPFVLEQWNGKTSSIRYRDTEETSAYQILSGGTASSFTAVSCSSFVPPNSRVAFINVMASGGGGGAAGTVWTRETGTNITIGKVVARQSLDSVSGYWRSDQIYPNTQTLNSSQQFDYRRNDGNASMHVLGYTINL
jgi:hypothetical protein